MEYASGSSGFNPGNGAAGIPNCDQGSWGMALRGIFAEGTSRQTETMDSSLQATPNEVTPRHFNPQATPRPNEATTHFHTQGITPTQAYFEGRGNGPPGLVIGPSIGPERHEYPHGRSRNVSIGLDLSSLQPSSRPTIGLRRQNARRDVEKTHVGYCLRLTVPERNVSWNGEEAKYAVGNLFESNGDWPLRSIGHHCLGYLIHPGSRIFPFYVPVHISFTLTNEAIAQRIENVVQCGLLEVEIGDSGGNPILPLFKLNGADIPGCIVWSPDRSMYYLPLKNTSILSEIILAPTIFGYRGNPRKRTNSTMSTTFHDGMVEERTSRAAEEVASTYKLSTYGSDHAQFTNEGSFNFVTDDGGGNIATGFPGNYSESVGSESTPFAFANPELSHPTLDYDIFGHAAGHDHGIARGSRHTRSHADFLPRGEMNGADGEPLQPSLSGQSLLGGPQFHGEQAPRGGQPSHGGQASHGGQPPHGGQVSRSGQASRGDQASLGEQPPRGGQPSRGSRKAVGPVPVKGKKKAKRAMANTPEPTEDPNDDVEKEKEALKKLEKEEKEDEDAEREGRPSTNPEGTGRAAHSPAMGVVLTFPLLFLRNLCFPGMTVTQHFKPRPSGGVTPLNLAKELYEEALVKRGLTAKDFGPKVTLWILKSGSQRIQRLAYRIKDNARIYVSGHTDNGGYGLTPNLTPKELYLLANALALDGNFLYAGGTKHTPGAVMFSNIAIWQFLYRILFESIRARVHPDGISGDKPGDFLDIAALKQGAIPPYMLIVTITSRFYDEISGFIYPYLESLDEAEREELLRTTHPSASVQYGIAHGLEGRPKKGPKGTLNYYAGVMREEHEELIVETRDQSIQVHADWAMPPAGPVCTKPVAESALRKQTAYR